MKLKANVLFLFSFSIFLFSCGGDSKNNTESIANDSINKRNSEKDTINNSAAVFALPAPLQIPTVLKNSHVTFSEKLLVPAKKNRVFSSDYARALNLGVYTTDLGYSTLFGQKQTTLNYYKEVNALLNDLQISANVTSNQFKQFEKNLDNSDSLCKIILKSFGQWQSYFQENKREEDGLYILAGTYIEGLYLSLNHPAVQNKKEFRNLIGQQKLFLENVLELSNYMDKKPEFDDLYLKLGAIQQAYEPIAVVVRQDNSGNSNVLCSYSNEQLADLTAVVNKVRSEIIKQ